jgi:D-proline reductase (dithiol) PrdB
MNLEILEDYIKQEWDADFCYAHFEAIPWTPFQKPFDTASVALVTTAGVHLRQDPAFAGVDDASYREIPGATPAGALTVSHPYFDSAELEQDIDAIFPLTRLRELQQQGLIRCVAPQHYSFMGVIPHWGRLERLAEDIARQLRSAGVDVVLLTPGSPICHHSLAIIQRGLEAGGLATISLTIEPEIMKLVKVPRSMVVDFPPGCPVGEPGEHEKQRKVVQEALEYLTTMMQPGTIWRSPFKWTRSCSTPVCKL